MEVHGITRVSKIQTGGKNTARTINIDGEDTMQRENTHYMVKQPLSIVHPGLGPADCR